MDPNLTNLAITAMAMIIPALVLPLLRWYAEKNGTNYGRWSVHHDVVATILFTTMIVLAIYTLPALHNWQTLAPATKAAITGLRLACPVLLSISCRIRKWKLLGILFAISGIVTAINLLSQFL